VGLHLAALAALASDVELASRLRYRARRTRLREADKADRERNRSAEARQRAARRAQLQDGCLVAQGRVLLSASPFNRGVSWNGAAPAAAREVLGSAERRWRQSAQSPRQAPAPAGYEWSPAQSATKNGARRSP
jgi:hypothetical protein